MESKLNDPDVKLNEERKGQGFIALLHRSDRIVEIIVGSPSKPIEPSWERELEEALR